MSGCREDAVDRVLIRGNKVGEGMNRQVESRETRDLHSLGYEVDLAEYIQVDVGAVEDIHKRAHGIDVEENGEKFGEKPGEEPPEQSPA